MFTIALHLPLSWVRLIQSITPHPIYLLSIFTLYSILHMCLPSALFPSGFPTKTFYAFFSPCILHALPISSSLTTSFQLCFCEEYKFGGSLWKFLTWNIKGKFADGYYSRSIFFKSAAFISLLLSLYIRIWTPMWNIKTSSLFSSYASANTIPYRMEVTWKWPKTL
jgi:hypothetical protein